MLQCTNMQLTNQTSDGGHFHIYFCSFPFFYFPFKCTCASKHKHTGNPFSIRSEDRRIILLWWVHSNCWEKVTFKNFIRCQSSLILLWMNQRGNWTLPTAKFGLRLSSSSTIRIINTDRKLVETVILTNALIGAWLIARQIGPIFSSPSTHIRAPIVKFHLSENFTPEYHDAWMLPG